MFFFALTWSIGGSCDDTGRVKFDKLIKELMSVSAVRYMPISRLYRAVNAHI